MSLTQENAFDLLYFGTVPYHSRRRSCTKHIDLVKSASFYHSVPFLPLVAIAFITSLKSNLCTDLTPQNAVENNSFNSHAQNTTELQPNVFSAGIRQFLVTNKERSAFTSASICQGQLQTPRSVSVEDQPSL